MNNEFDIDELINMLLEQVIAFHPIFKKITGHTASGIFLSQLYYWSKQKSTKEKGGWTKISGTEWDDLGLTRTELETARLICCDNLKVVEKKKKRWNNHGTYHYRVNIPRLNELIKQHASLQKTRKLTSMRKTRKLIDSGKPANYLTKTTRDYPPKSHGGGIFKSWNDTPEALHPYFQACINKPIALPEPTTKREITAWFETFDEWTQKGFAPDQVVAAARWARKNNKAIARPGSLTWILNDQHSRKNGQEDHAKGTGESMLEKLAMNQRRK